MALQWTADLSVGNEQIDHQHRELFRRFDDLLEACNQRKGKEKVVELLNFLDQYVITHFGNEEKLMDEFAYPDSAEHKEQHKYFTRKMVALREDLQTNGPSVSLVINTNQTILRWLIDHIKKVDLRLGAFLKSRS